MKKMLDINIKTFVYYNMKNIVILLILSILLSGCSLSGNGASSSRAKTKMLNSMMRKQGSPFKYSLSDSVERCKKLEKFCGKRRFNKYGNPATDGTKDDNFYCVCIY